MRIAEGKMHASAIGFANRGGVRSAIISLSFIFCLMSAIPALAGAFPGRTARRQSDLNRNDLVVGTQTTFGVSFIKLDYTITKP